jgi:Leucine-rich repeat (LRR) protein
MKWNDVTAQWQRVISELYFKQSTDQINEESLHSILCTPTLRMVGPTGINPSLSFEIDSLDGIEIFTELEFLFIISTAIKGISPLKNLHKLKSVFLNDNKIGSLSGIEYCTEITELYCQGNQLTSIKEVEPLVKLKTLMCQNNTGLTSFEGLTKAHANTLEKFYGLPNRGISPAELQRVEYEFGITVLRG